MAAVLLATAAPAAETPAAAGFAGPIDAGLMAEPTHREASGLAPSRRADGLFWTHGDSGNPPVLHAVGADGERRGRLRLEEVRNVDWEDLASFTLDGTAWLAVADCGDNHGTRPRGVIHFVPEPDPATLLPAGEVTARPAWSLHYTYEDGPRDSEAIAVDPRERAVYLLSKREIPARLYRVELQPASALFPALARFVGEVPGLPQPNELQRRITLPLFAYLGQPTAMDFSADGSLAVVLTYGHTLLFARAAGESWAAALGRPPVRLGGHALPQAEAACFSRDARAIVVCSEQTLRWLRYERRKP